MVTPDGNVYFRVKVQFMRFPLLPPTIENCRKCRFRIEQLGGCIKTDLRECRIGREGYYDGGVFRELIER